MKRQNYKIILIITTLTLKRNQYWHQTQLGAVGAHLPPSPHNHGALPLQDGQVVFIYHNENEEVKSERKDDGKNLKKKTHICLSKQPIHYLLTLDFSWSGYCDICMKFFS